MGKRVKDSDISGFAADNEHAEDVRRCRCHYCGAPLVDGSYGMRCSECIQGPWYSFPAVAEMCGLTVTDRMRGRDVKRIVRQYCRDAINR